MLAFKLLLLHLKVIFLLHLIDGKLSVVDLLHLVHVFLGIYHCVFVVANGIVGLEKIEASIGIGCDFGAIEYCGVIYAELIIGLGQVVISGVTIKLFPMFVVGSFQQYKALFV